jgi:heme/copper-type cytochrome/quinol oxidase subunit 2
MPVSFVTLVFILVLFASFLLVVRKSYRPAAAAPENEVADNLPAELAWRATPESRRAALQELRKREAAELSSYAWIDRDSGVVQLPIERAMELTVQQYRGRR